jgi:hypothetical protein
MKLYDRDEIGAILKKAAENSSSDGTGSHIGLTIDELQQLASDTGIDPEQITKAAAELAGDKSRNDNTFWGGPFSFNRQVLVEGEITVGQWEDMLISIREFFQSNGQVTTRDSVWEWSSPRGSTNTAQVTVLTDNEQTKISVGWNGPLTALPFYLPMPLTAIASIFFASEFLELSAIPGLAFTVLATGLAFLAGRWALRRHLDKAFSRFREMIAGLELIASKDNTKAEIVPGQIDVNQTQAECPILQLDEMTDQIDSDVISKRRNRSQS